jgi:hypothetical protein
MTTFGHGNDYGYGKLQHVNREGALKGNITAKSYTLSGATTLKPSQCMLGILRLDPDGASRTVTTPTAEALKTKFPDAEVGDYWELIIYNTGNGTTSLIENLTLAGGSGVTIVGETVIPQGASAKLMFRWTNIGSSEALDLYTSVSYPYSAIVFKQKLVSITAATYAPAATESGTTFLLNRAAGIAVTLPTPASGLYYKFINATAVSGDTTITATSDGVVAANIIFGPTFASDGTAAAVGAGEDVITIANANDTKGDYVELLCDGTNWFVVGGAAVAAGLTIA